jgi:hypothetical protein
MSFAPTSMSIAPNWKRNSALWDLNTAQSTISSGNIRSDGNPKVKRVAIVCEKLNKKSYF